MNSNSKIAIVTFHNSFSPNEIGGGTSAPIYFYEQMKRYYPNIDIITLRNNKNYHSPLASVVQYQEDPSVLDNYDFVIFTAPGLTYEKYDEKDPNRYIDILNHAKKFAFMCHEENDRKLYPYHMNFLKHPNISFVLFNCPGMANCFQDYIELSGDYEYVNYSPVLPDKAEILEKAKNKQDKIMSTCRWTTAKRVYEYLSMTEEFISNGIEVHAAGAHQSYWYNLRMEELPCKDYIDHGYFEPSQVPELLSDVKYHWNFLFLMKDMGHRNHNPRLEVATMEAIREGCLPVLCEETTPEWLGYDSAIRLSKKNYTDIPQVLGNLSDDERLERISRLYDLVQENIIKHYEHVANHIESYINPMES